VPAASQHAITVSRSAFPNAAAPPAYLTIRAARERPQQPVRLALVEIPPKPDVPVREREHRLGLPLQVKRDLAKRPRVEPKPRILDHALLPATGSALALTILGDLIMLQCENFSCRRVLDAGCREVCSPVWMAGFVAIVLTPQANRTDVAVQPAAPLSRSRSRIANGQPVVVARTAEGCRPPAEEARARAGLARSYSSGGTCDALVVVSASSS
jgi:hypothetical protein